MGSWVISGLVLIVDPFSIEALTNDPKHHGYVQNYEGEISLLTKAEEPLSRMVLSMESSFGLSHTDKIKKPLAVVLNKTDTFDLESLIGESAVERASRRLNQTDKASVRDKLVREKLLQWGEKALLQQIDTRFSRVRFFTCHSLHERHTQKGVEMTFSPNDVFEPIHWLLQEVNKTYFAYRSGRK